MCQYIVSSKSNQKAKKVETQRLGNAPFGERRLLSILDIFIRFAQYDTLQDMVFSRPHASRLRGTFSDPLPAALGDGERFRYQQDIVNDLVKMCAIRFDLDPDLFSTKSFKNCGISTMQTHREELNMSEKEVATSFAHASVSSNRHYQRADLSQSGPLGFMNEHGNELYKHENLEILKESRKSGSRSNLSKR